MLSEQGNWRARKDMKLRGSSKTRESRYNAKVGFIVGIGMLIIVITNFNFSGAGVSGKVFMVLILFALVAGLYQSYRNGFTVNGIEHEVTDHDLRLEGAITSGNSSVDFAKKLRALDNLKKEGLIDEKEYFQKREDILDEDWGK